MLCLPWLIVQNSTAGHLTIFKNVSAVSTKLNSTYWFDIVLTRWVFYNNAQNHVSYSLFVMCLKDASCLMWTVILRTITGFRFIIVWHAICIKSLSRYTSHDRVYLPTGRVYLPTGRDYLPTGRVHLPTGRVYLPTGRVYLPIYVEKNPVQKNLVEF